MTPHNIFKQVGNDPSGTLNIPAGGVVIFGHGNINGGSVSQIGADFSTIDNQLDVDVNDQAAGGGEYNAVGNASGAVSLDITSSPSQAGTIWASWSPP